MAFQTDVTTLNDQSATSVSLEKILTKEQESLIKLEYQFVSSECPSMNLDSTLQVISLQVNNLDIILNPETIVELIGFLQKSFPKEKDDVSPQPLLQPPCPSPAASVPPSWAPAVWNHLPK